MNMRMDAQSVRFRLNQKEAVQLLEQKYLEEVVLFSPTQKFLIVLYVDNYLGKEISTGCSLEWRDSAVKVGLAEQLLRTLLEQKQNKDNGIKFNQHTLLVSIEVDLWNRS